MDQYKRNTNSKNNCPMKKIILLFIIGMVFFSCKKKQTIHITAKNAATGEPYSGLTYYVVTHKNVLKPYGGKKAKTVATGTLDENGEAIVTKRLSKNNGHGVRVEEPENSCYNKNIQLYFSEEDGKNFKAEFEFAECAYLKLNIHNINCQSPTDSMRFRSKYDYENQWQGWTTYRKGCYDFDSPDYFKVSQGTRMYEWEVIRNGNKTTHSGSVLLNKGAYETFEINY